MLRKELNHFDLGQIADSGQCFRLNRAEAGAYTLVAGARFLRLRQLGGGVFEFGCSEAEFEAFWQEYFDLGQEYGRFADAIPPGDGFLTRAAAFSSGVRLLRQDPFEMLITFILSQRKNIPAIKKGVESLCRCFGQPLAGDGAGFWAFPTAGALAAAPLEALRGCALGYRAPYVQAAAAMVAEGRLNLGALAALPNNELLAALMAVPGVGVKVANCVLLFGYHRIDAFPVDVWIQRIIDEEYGGVFSPEPYRGFEGIIQQYMFYYARHGRGKGQR